MSGESRPPRRAVIFGGLGALGLGLAAVLAVEAPRLFGARYRPTPFDDLLSQLPDRENAKVLGSAVLAKLKLFNAETAAAQLRARMKTASLGEAMKGDLRTRQLAEIHGWVLPQTLTTLCAIAAKAG
jgi:hypothetical protein